MEFTLKRMNTDYSGYHIGNFQLNNKVTKKLTLLCSQGCENLTGILGLR